MEIIKYKSYVPCQKLGARCRGVILRCWYGACVGVGGCWGEAVANVFWLNPFPTITDDVQISSATPSWESVRRMADLFLLFYGQQALADDLQIGCVARGSRIHFPIPPYCPCPDAVRLSKATIPR